MAGATQKDFVLELTRLLRLLDIMDGTKAEVKVSPDDTGGAAVLKGWGEKRATLVWDADLTWTLYVDYDATSRKVKSGTYPQRSFSFHLLSASGAISRPPSVQVGQSNAIIKFLLSFTAISAIIILGKILFISSNSQSLARIPSVLTAQELLASFSFEDSVNIVLGTVLANGVLSLVLVAATTYTVYRHSFPDYVLSTDEVGWGAAMLLLLGGPSLILALLIADWPWKACIAGGAALIYWADRVRTGLPRELAKWRKYGTLVGHAAGLTRRRCRYVWNEK